MKYQNKNNSESSNNSLLLLKIAINELFCLDTNKSNELISAKRSLLIVTAKLTDIIGNMQKIIKICDIISNHFWSGIKSDLYKK